MKSLTAVETGRLLLPAASAEELAAMIDGDRVRIEALIGASAPDPMIAPPETGDVLDWFRTAIEEDEAIRPWFFRWVVDRTRMVLVGSVGFAGYPNDEGAVFLGYSVYPGFERRGFASEAAAAMVNWALAQERVTSVQATIFPGHSASERVAAYAGLRPIREFETEDGIVRLWSILRQERTLTP